jgi:TP901 family phage tail tape measure protein
MAMGQAVVEELIVRLSGDPSSFKRMMAEARSTTLSAARDIERAGGRIENINRSLNNAGRSMMSAGRAVMGVGRNITAGLTAPIAGMGIFAVRSFADFDQAMTETFAKLGRQTPEVRRQMEDLAFALSVSGDVAFSPTELSRGYEELASAGLDAERSMAALPMMAMFAQAGAFDMGVAVKQMTGSMASFGALSRDPAVFSRNLERFADVMVGVANETTTGVEQVARAMAADAAVAARGYGMEIETLGAILGVFAMQNKDAEEAGNLTGRALRLMTSSFVENRAEWLAAGINIADAQGNFIHFADAIAQLEVAFEGLSNIERIQLLKKLGFETLSQKSILPLIGMSQEIRRQEAIYRRTGVTAEMAAIQMESFKNQLKVVWNNVTVAAIVIGEMLAPALITMSGWIRDAVQWFGQLNPEIQKMAVYVAGGAALIGPALMAIGAFSLLAGAGLRSLAGTLWLVTGGVKGLFGLIARHPFMAIIAVVAAVASQFIDWRYVIDLVSFSFSHLGEVSTYVWTGIQLAAVTAFDFMRDGAITFSATMVGAAHAVGGLFSSLWQNLRAGSERAVNFIVAGWRAVKDPLNFRSTFQRELADLNRNATQFVNLGQGTADAFNRGFSETVELLGGVGISQTQRDLRAEFAQQGEALGQSFEEWRAARGATAGAQTASGGGIWSLFNEAISAGGGSVTAAAREAGAAVGSNFTEGAKGEMQKFDAVLFRSAEGMARLAGYSSRFFARGIVSPTAAPSLSSPMPGNPTPVSSVGPRGGGTNDRVVTLLTEIRDALVRRPPPAITLQPG